MDAGFGSQMGGAPVRFGSTNQRSIWRAKNRLHRLVGNEGGRSTNTRQTSLVRKSRQHCRRLRRLADFRLLRAGLAIDEFQVAGAQTGERNGRRVTIVL